VDPAFRAVFNELCWSADQGRVLVTSRYPVPEDNGLLTEIRLSGLSASELRRMFARLPALRGMAREDQRLVAAAIGGHPRLIEFVDALMRDGRSDLRSVTNRLRDLTRGHEIGLPVAPIRQPPRHTRCSLAGATSCWRNCYSS
jgi:hypothetical protein